jgi:hypothetical protein
MDPLEEYAHALKRHLDFRTKARFRIFQRQLVLVLNRRTREMVLRQLQQMFEQDDFEHFKAVFREVRDDLDQQ